MTDPLDNLRLVQEKIARAAERSGRKRDSITLVAVTKTVPLERLRLVLENGVLDIGENRVQEALTKFEGMKTALATPLVMHLIGPLQSNKAKKAVGFFDVIQSLDNLDLAEDIHRHATALGKKQTCLIEVKISPETSKSGIAPDLLPEFIDQLRELPALRVRGLMGIPPHEAAGEAARPYFQTLRTLFDSVKQKAEGETSFDTLSMGMSSDYEVAIEEGATMIRIGSALFGAR